MMPLKSMPRLESGVAVLPVALILLVGAALMLFFSQKNLLVDLQITRNGYASRVAYAAADSGLAVALARLNDPEQRKAILSDIKGTGFYDALVSPSFTEHLDEGIEARVLLKALSLGVPDLRIQVLSTGCVSDCTRSRATVKQTLAMRGGIHRIPFALVSARGDISVAGPVTLSNTTAAVRGMLMHAGGGVGHDEAVKRVTLPGVSPNDAELALDKTYAQQTADQFFFQWFGADKAFIKAQSLGLSCQGDCSSLVAGQGSRVIWLDGDARLENGTIGSINAPVILIASGNLQLGGSVHVTGVIYSMAPWTRVQLAGTSGSLDGAILAENDVIIEQGGRLSYNPIVLHRAQSMLGSFVPIPGSWGDGE